MGSWVSFVLGSTSRRRSSQDLPTPLSLPRVRDEGKRNELEHNAKLWGRNRVPVAAIVRLAVLLYLEKKTVRFAAAFVRKQGTNRSSAPSGSAASGETGHDPNKCPKMKNEDANLAISDQASLVADADAFVSVSQEEHEFRFGRSGGTEGLDC